MAYSYDDLLIESIATRRQRLGAALMFGEGRLRREWNDRTKTFMASVFLAALAAAVCVAISFVSNLLSKDMNLRNTPPSSSPSTSAPSLPGPVGGAG